MSKGEDYEPDNKDRVVEQSADDKDVQYLMNVHSFTSAGILILISRIFARDERYAARDL